MKRVLPDKPHLRDSNPDSFRTFGRAKGRPLSPKQAGLYAELYPKIAVDTTFVGAPLVGLDAYDEVWFEIGFGGAEHLIWQAAHNPTVALIGAEPFEPGIAKALSGVKAGGVEQGDLDGGGLDGRGLANVRLHHGDARLVMATLPDACLSKLFVLFPDPWPKPKHHKRRIINPAFLDDIHRVLKPGGEFRFGSDILHYVDWTLSRVKAHGGFSWHPKTQTDWRVRGNDWPQTRYLAKALREGRTGHFFTFIRD